MDDDDINIGFMPSGHLSSGGGRARPKRLVNWSQNNYFILTFVIAI